MTDRPIIFSSAMVRALLDGRKTMTRRLATSPLRKTGMGDRLWVRESVWLNQGDVGAGRVRYRATEPDFKGYWTPSIHMPRWASRITLEVTGSRIERLQAITERDAQAEGAELAIAGTDYWSGPLRTY